ncbi:glycosyltransferase family 2 protein [uncultured Zobellia sp.]|uniref:glycosyltransferase family 2 protein n=1 Tax=uncultured Zobellia sp. TaxID=255433 RepID=UPI00259A7483|nr:glycosyltransferase family 2 protein [uncultured Zobellia sp.]
MFSVVIPLYNKAHTIVNTLQSVLSQSYSEFEVVIVNDGSTDNGVEVIQNLTKDPRIKIIDQENQGVSAARNRGVEESSFDYIAFLDGDDEWESKYLERMHEAIVKHPEAGMFCSAGTIRSGEHSILRLAKKYANTICSVDFFENPHVFLHTSATVVKKIDFYKTGGFPVGMRRNQDFACFFSIGLITPVVYIGIPLSVYVGDVPGQATKTSMSKVMPHVIDRFNHVHNIWKKSTLKNRGYLVFLRYELRHMFLMLLKSEEDDMIRLMLQNLDKDILDEFLPFELALFTKKSQKYLGIYFIYMTKVRWRLRGYPRTGE